MRVLITVIGLGCALTWGACSSTKHTATGNVRAIKDPTIIQQRSDSLFFAAQRSKMLGDYKTAITQFSDYLRLNRQNPTVFYELSRLFMEVNNPSYALGFARRAAAMDTTNRWFQLALADALGMNQMFDSAAVVYDRLSRQYPESEDYLFNKAMLLSKAGKTDEALAVFDKLEEKTGIVEELVYQKQRLLLKQSKVEEAAAEIRKLIDQNPAEVRYYQLLADVYDANDRVQEATGIYDTILTKDPNNARSLIALANYAKQRGDSTVYWEYLTKAFANPDYSIDEKVAFVYPYLQMMTLDSSKLKEGLQLTRLVIRAHPTEAKAYALEADMYSQADMLDSALNDYNKAISLDSTRFSVWYQLMWIYSRKDETKELLKASTVVTQRFPEEFMGFYFKGVATYMLQQFPDAIRSLNKALTLGSGDKRFMGDVYSLLGDSYHALGQHQQSDSSYERALILRPDDAMVLNNYSYYLSMRGEQLEKAAQMSHRSLELQPGSATYMDTYAWILFRQGKYEDAKEWIEKALQDPEAQKDPSVLEHYGDILFNLKDVAKALEYWQRAKEKGASSVGLARKIAEKRYIDL
ncbi:Tetratricopeptide repeat-containing protein [Chitinophaga rupis]|uniref:Tetratricopeptide repeat-containing protein n=1 Tax=Chitinophaga rupis TaxID=573321 RepID=A0A1H8I788_9BACT|nr:tetratricopeptide repeat protein [Chitinophaga rupis]SEN63718.1 Tetratricopeptide repeat-containing protein [Chitinophaga rupis]